MPPWKQIAAARSVLSRETGAVHKDHGGRLRVALTYPNTYAVGMSSLALQLLYRDLNDRSDVVCERVFWEPYADGAAPLTLESQSPARDFDVWAFSVSFELDYFNVASMLAIAGVSHWAEAVDDPSARPLLIAGGPALSMNPEPMAPFFDAIVIGEVEEVLGSLLDRLAGGIGGDRQRLLDELERLPGVYIPSRAAGRPIERLWVRDLARLRTESSLYTPDAEFANRHLIEIARGCGRGCRFCLAGYVYRPPREQTLEHILDMAQAALALRLPVYTHGGATGAQAPSLGLVSAAVSDHSHIDEMALALGELGARVTVSSMRTDPISVPLLKALAASGTQTLTIAPEAGSERLRRVINKTQCEDDILEAVALAQEYGFPLLKLYFMVGHPTETDDDIQAIVDLSLRARSLFRRNIAINATPFVPKAHTPFQWQPMVPAKILAQRQRTLQRALARHQIQVSSDSPDLAEVQAVLSRGDRLLAPVIASCGRPTPRAFMAALRDAGLSPEVYLGGRDSAETMPWDVVESGIKPSFYRYEARLSEQARSGHHCPPGADDCLTCGVCRALVDVEAIKVDETRLR